MLHDYGWISEYSHSTAEMELECNPETQLRSPTMNEDSVDCNPWDSRGRRLFPQRRPSIPTSVSHNANARPGFPLFETSPSRDYSPIDGQGCDSKISSPSSVDSVATVQVRVSPAPSRPCAETDLRVGKYSHVRIPSFTGSIIRCCSVERSITPHRPTKERLETRFSEALYTDRPIRYNLQWESMEQLHKLGYRLRARNLSEISNGEPIPHDRDTSQDGLPLTTDNLKSIPPIEISSCQWSQLGQSRGGVPHPGLLPIEPGEDCLHEDDMPFVTKDDVPALKSATCDCRVKLSTVATVSADGKLHVHHLAVLSVIMPLEEFCAEKVSFTFVVTNALRNDHKFSLQPGQTSLLFKEDVSRPGFFPRGGAELVILRNRYDFAKPVNLYFAFTYPSPRHFVIASLPTFRPKMGRSLSEVVFIAEPLPPLCIKTFIRDSLSSWRLCHHPVTQVICYERIGLPRGCPAGFQDDIQMRILELSLVRFGALGESPISTVIWKLDITIHELFGETVECRMSFFLEVGAAASLVSLIPHGWVPQYFIVDGRVMNEQIGQCWKNEEGHITIIKQGHVGLGPIMVETYWQGPPKRENDDGYSTNNLPLPTIVGRKVLGGKLTSQANESKYNQQRALDSLLILAQLSF